MSKQFCVYLTIYSGNKLPLFYVGSSTVSKVKNGYHGSVSSKQFKDIWCEELKINPHLFKTIIISYHDDRLEATTKELKLQKALKVSRNPMYINRAYAQKNGCFGLIGDDNPMRTLPKEKLPGYGRTGDKHPMYGVRGQKHPSYGIKIPTTRFHNMRDDHPDFNGSKNPRAKVWRLTSPDGKEIICHGNIESVLKEHNLGYLLLRKHMGQVVPPLSKMVHHPISKNTVGWKLEFIS